VLEALPLPGGPSAEFRFDLARKAFAHTAAYDAAIASTLGTVRAEDAGFVRPAPGTYRWPSRTGPRPSKLARPSLRREPASEGSVVRAHARRVRRGRHPAGKGTVVHEPAGSRFRRNASSSSSASPRRPSSNTRTRAARRRARRRSTPTSALVS
jgi:hypothetical protein